MARPRTGGSLFNPVNTYARPSAYDPNRQAPTGRNANPNGSPLNPYQMEQWNRSRREAANDYAYQNRGRGIQNPVTPIREYPAGAGDYQFAGLKHDRSQQEFNGDNETSYYNNPVRPVQTPRTQAVEYDGDNESSYYGAPVAPVSPINNDHGVSRPRTVIENPVAPPSVPIPNQLPPMRVSPPTHSQVQAAFPPAAPEYPAADVPRLPSVPQGPRLPSGQGPFGGATQVTPRVDLSGMAGQPATSNSSLVGMLMPGYAGMITQGMLAGMGRGYTEGQNRSDVNKARMFNNGQAVDQGPWDAREAQQARTENFQGMNPVPGSSTGAARVAESIPADLQNPITSRIANGYNGFVADVNDPNRMSPDDKYALAQQAAGGMSESPLSGRAGIPAQPKVTGGYHVRGNYGEYGEDRIANAAPEVQYGPNARGNVTSSLPPSSDPVLARQNAMMKKPGPRYIPLTPERRAEKAAEKEAEKTRRADVKFKHLVGQGMNPLSPKARGMFPEQVARMKQGLGAGDNPVGSPFSTTAPNTPENQQARQVAGLSNLQSSPYLQKLGVKVGDNPDTFARLFYQGSSSPISDEDLQATFNHIKTIGPTEEGYSPFAGSELNPVVGTDLLSELWSMPENASVSDLRSWHTRYMKTQAERLAAPPK